MAPAVYGDRRPLQVAAAHLEGEPVPYAEAIRRRFVRFAVGDAWGTTWGTTWFRLRGSVPGRWAGREVVALVDVGYSGATGFGGEALAWRDGLPLQGLSPNHHDLPVARPAAGAERVELLIEAAANPSLNLTFSPAPKPAPMAMPDPSGAPRFRLARAELAVFEREVYDLQQDMRVLLSLAEALHAGEPRCVEILEALGQACRSLRLESVAATAAAARACLAEALGRPATASSHRISAVGHAHIDTAWLWPLREARRKCARTFSSVLGLMEEYPDLRFACSQALHYAWIKEDLPSLYARIKAEVVAGRFEPVGSMWVEADCNLTSGESLARQILHGKRFFLREFGYETEDCWLPDVFGYSAAMPQLLAHAGIRWFLTQKISWNEANRFPHHTFWWEGIDGTRVFAHFPPTDTYNATLDPDELVAHVRRFRDHASAGRSLVAFGHGDGGGGPSRDMIEAGRRQRDLEGAPKVELERASDFFRKAEAEAQGHELPVWVGELYLENHRGTYTTQSRVKAGNRRAELGLRDAELLAALRPRAWRSYPAARLEAAWKMLLVNQFHDILPGSSIHWVYEQAERELQEVREEAAAVAAEAATAIAGAIGTAGMSRPLVLFNTNSHHRREVVRHGGRTFVAEVPPCGYAAYDLAAPGLEAPAAVAAGDRWMENDYLRVRWDEHGLLTSIVDKRAQHEVLAGPGNLFQLHRDHPSRWDAWNVDAHYLEDAENLSAVHRLRLTERGPLRAALRIERRFGRSRLRQVMSLDAGSSLLRFDTEVDWHEDHRFLKVGFPVAVHAHRATYEIQYGHVERPTHWNTSWDATRFEVCAQKWVDLSEPGYGVALLNDCKYGHDIRGNVMRLSLLRATTNPDPVADRGRDRFGYALLPHRSDLRQAGVIEAAYDFNVPLVPVETGVHRGGLPVRKSYLAFDRPGPIIEAVKRAEDEDALVIRLYEAYGSRGPAVLRLGMRVSGAWRTDLLERPQQEVAVAAGAVRLDLRPFEIVTLKLAP